MPSPFPGMDPYLEDPAIWPDFHDRFATEISVALNNVLPPHLYARLEMRPEIGIVSDDEWRPIVPDVSISQSPRRSTIPAFETGGGTAVAAEPRVEPSESIRLKATIESIRHQFVEIRDARQGHSLVTLIEIVSPSNKRPGDDRKNYLRKQREVLDSEASLVEVDLHATGEPVVGASSMVGFMSRMSRDGRYVVCVSRAWERSTQVEYEIYLFSLSQCLPCVGVPLREGEKQVPLDLQFVFQKAYDGGPYRRGAVEYEKPPAVPLTENEQRWVRECVAAAFPGTSEAGQ